MQIELKILNKEFYTACNCLDCLNSEKYPLPTYATPSSAAMDLVCTEDVTIDPGEVKAIHTGLAIWIGASTSKIYPRDAQGRSLPLDSVCNAFDVAALILPRSGLGTKGLVLANTIGLIDEDYQGELIVQAWNRNEITCCSAFETDEGISLKAGERFAQLMFVPVIKCSWQVVDEFSSATTRATGGFGSTNR